MNSPPLPHATAPRRTLRLSLSRWLVVAAVLAPAVAHAAKVRGRVDGFRNLLNPVWADARDPKLHGYSFREPVPTVRAEFRRLFPHAPKEICVAALAVGAQKPTPPVLVRVGGGRTTPVTLVVPPGTRLTFQNTDAFKHRLYGVGIATFQPADTLRAANREWSVPGPGTFEIRDELAPSLRMWVIGEPTVAAIAYPSTKGDFGLSVEQPGDYVVQAFFAGKKVGPAVPVKVDVQDVNLSKAPLKVGDERAAAAADKAEAEKEKAKPDEKEGGGEIMLLSRFWYVLLGLLLGAALFLLGIASSMYNRSGLRARAEALSSDAQVVSWYLRDDARQRSAQLIPFALDPDIAKNLARATESESRVPSDARVKLLEALKRVNAQIPKELAFDSVFAVNQAGRVVAYLGYVQASGQEDFELGGYPVVADALHGYVRDDTLVLDRPYRVVARPVEFDLASMPAGAIVGARVVDDHFARELSQRTGAAVAFYANGQRAAAAAPEGFNTAQLDQIVGDLGDLEQDKDYKEKGRSSVREIGTLLSVQYTRLPGEAWQLGAGYAVARLPAAVSGPFGFFAKADDKDKKAGNLLLAIVVAIVGAGLGLGFSVLEHTRPLRVFKDEAGRLASGVIDQLTPSRFRGIYRKIASDLNDGVDKQLAKGGGPRRGPADFKEVLGDLPDQPQMSAFSLPGDASQPDSGSNSAPSGSQSDRPGPSRPLPSPPGAKRPRPSPAAPAVAAAPQQLDATMPEGGLAGWGSGAPDESEWRGVYDDFVALKQQCGENVEGFTYDKFEVTLRKNRDTLVQRHGAKRVKFSVYVKEGRAALKANPIKD